MRTPRTITILLTALAISCVKETPGERVQPGEQLPDFSTVTLSGRNAGKETLLGKPSAIILFSTTCPDCHRQLPELESTYRTLGQGIKVLAIARDEPQKTVSAFWTSSGYTMDVAAPGDRTIYDLFDRGSRSGVPLLYLCDRGGTVVRVADDTETLSANEIITTLSKTQ